MKKFASPLILILAALAAGVGTGIVLRGISAASDSARDGRNASLRDSEGLGTGEEVNPGLLRELRALEAMADGPAFAGMRSADFPLALLKAYGEMNEVAVAALFRKWREIDGEGMVGFFLKEGDFDLRGTTGPGFDCEDAFFQALVEQDPRGAVGIALRFPRKEGCLGTVLAFIAERDFDLTAELMLENLEELALQRGLHFEGETNRKLARMVAEQESFGPNERKVLLQFWPHWLGLEFWASLTPGARERTARMFLPERGYDSPEMTELYTVLTRQFESGPQAEGRRWGDYFVVFSERIIREKGLEETLAWAAEHLGAGELTDVFYPLLWHVRAQAESREFALGEMEWLPAGKDKERLVSQTAYNLAFDDPQGALDWASGLPPDGAAASSMDRIAGLWASRDFAAAEAAALRMPPGYHADAFIGALGEEKLIESGAGEAFAWARGLPAGRTRAAEEGIVKYWTMMNAEAAFDYLAEMENGPHRDALLGVGIRERLRKLHHPRASASWLSELGVVEAEWAREAIRESDLEVDARTRAMAELDGGERDK